MCIRDRNNTASFIYQIRPFVRFLCPYLYRYHYTLSFPRIQCENSVFPALIPQNLQFLHSYFWYTCWRTILSVSYTHLAPRWCAPECTDASFHPCTWRQRCKTPASERSRRPWRLSLIHISRIDIKEYPRLFFLLRRWKIFIFQLIKFTFSSSCRHS